MSERKRIPAWVWRLAGLLLLAIVIRMAVWLTYQPEQTSDAQGYILMAHMVYTRRFFINIGARPPAYPALITWLAMSKYGLNERTIWLFQSGLGVLGAGVWFLAGWKLTRKSWFAFTAGLACAINLSLVFFEPLIMTEAVSTFLVLVTFLLVGLLGKGEKPGWGRAAALGVVAGAAALTRPLFLYLGMFFLIYLWWRLSADRFLVRVGVGLAYLVPLAALVLGWSYFNWQTTGYFGLTTMSGYNLINHTGAFIEFAPEEYAGVRDVYLPYRAERIAETGNQAMTIWRALPDMAAASGLSYVQLSQYLTRMSVDLILRRPDLYLLSAARAWVGFWKVPNYWHPGEIQAGWLATLLGALWPVERWLLISINFVFLAGGVTWIILAWRRRQADFESTLLWIWLSILGASLVQALMDYGENPRYGVPFEALIVWVVLAGGRELWRRKAATL